MIWYVARQKDPYIATVLKRTFKLSGRSDLCNMTMSILINKMAFKENELAHNILAINILHARFLVPSANVSIGFKISVYLRLATVLWQAIKSNGLTPPLKFEMKLRFFPDIHLRSLCTFQRIQDSVKNKIR